MRLVKNSTPTKQSVVTSQQIIGALPHTPTHKNVNTEACPVISVVYTYVFFAFRVRKISACDILRQQHFH